MTAMTSVGLLFRELPVGIRLKDSTTLRELFADVHTQVQKGIEHSCYPYVDINHRAGSEEAAYLLYQQDIRDSAGSGDPQNSQTDVTVCELRKKYTGKTTFFEIIKGVFGRKR